MQKAHGGAVLVVGAMRRAAWTAAALAMVAGVGAAIAQQDQPLPPPDDVSGTPEMREAERLQLERERLQREQQLRRATRPQAAPGAAQPDGAAAAGGAPDLALPDVGPDQVSFAQFAEPIELAALVDLVAKELGINIIVADAQVTGTVVFRAPMTVRKTELIPLLQMLLEPNGYALTKDPALDVYVVRPSGNLPVNLGGGDLTTTQVFPTGLLRPSAIQQALSTQLQTEGTASRIAYVDELNVIISTASPRQNQSIGQIIELLVRGQKDQRLHRFDLTHVAALEAKARILDLLGQAAARGGAAGGAAAQGGGAPAVAAGGVGNLSSLPERLIADRMGNSLIFRGSDAEADQVRQYIDLVDAPSRLIIRRYNAGPMSPLIAQFGERLGLGPVGQGAPAAAPGAAGGGAAAPVAGAGTGGVGSGFSIDGGDPESFTYYGTPAQHEQVERLIATHAEQARGEMLEIKFYKLRHARAADAADLLSQLLLGAEGGAASSPFLPDSLTNTRGLSRFDTQTGGLQRTRPTRRGAAATGGPLDPVATGDAALAPEELLAVEGLSIIADEPNNQLIIRAPARQQSAIRALIDQLDVRRPQVYIEVQIVSVNRSRDFEFGVDYAIESDDFPFFTNFGIRGGTDPFGTTIPNAAGVTAAIVRSSYIPVIVNLLETKGEGRIVSTPRLLVNDNEEAQLASTRDEPFATTTQTAGAPSQTGLGGTLSAGTTLNIRPQVSEGGFMILEFEVELSSFGERPNPDLPPARLSDNFLSIVTLPSDSTVVIGGLTFVTDNTTKNQIPLLGDIPFFGNFFGSRVDDTSERTIYVFITPRVLRDPTFADLRLLTRGPLADVSGKDIVPPLMPVDMEVIYAPAPRLGPPYGGAEEGPGPAPDPAGEPLKAAAAMGPISRSDRRSNDDVR